MTSSLRCAAVALCAALAFTACTKSSQTSSTTDATQTTAPDTTQVAGASASPAAAATDAAAASATAPASTAPGTTTTTTTTTTTAGNGSSGASTGYIDLPVYPGSAENKSQDLSMSANGNSVLIRVYETKDDAGKVANWYKSNLPAAWKNSILTSDNKTAATFSNEMSDGDQSVLITTQDGVTTRIQLATKHGK